MENVATVAKEVVLLNVTVPVPPNFDQVCVRVLPEGKPVAVPLKLAVAGRVMV